MLSNIVVDLVQVENFNVEDVGLRKASLLDVPYVFELLLEGAFFGAFSASFMLPNGTMRLLYYVFKLWFNQFSWGRRSYQPAALLMLNKQDKDIGFTYLQEVKVGEKKNTFLVLSLMSISKEYRNQKIGTEVVNKIYNAIPPGDSMAVACTKYAVVMQKILRKLKFSASKNRLYGLREFTKTKSQA